MASGAAVLDARERTRFQVEADPERGAERDQRQLAPQLRVRRVTRGGLGGQGLAAVDDQAQHAGLVLRDLGGGVRHDFDVHMRQRAGLDPIPAGNGLEVHGLAGRPRRHPKGPAADQRVRLGGPRVLARGRDDSLIHDPERPQANQGEEVARALAQGD